jgi:HK97 family phage portal protein
MNFWKRIFSRESKFSDARKIIAINKVGQAQFTPRNYESFSKEAFQKNVVAYRAISIISQACGGIPWILKKRTKEIETHALLTLLEKPNPMQGQASFVEAVFGYYGISGNVYIESVGPSPKAPPMELWVHRPDRMKVVPGMTGLPGAFEYSLNGAKKTWIVDQVKGTSPILHMKTFNPVDDWYGMSPVEAAVYAVDQHNEAGRWNLSLLQNSATPSGAFIVKSDDANSGGHLTDPQFENLKNMIDERYSGSRNAGRPMLLEGGLDWKQMSFSPKDMDWINSKHTSARDIALAFGLPPLLLNIPGDNTFANYKEARQALYEDTVIPLMDRLRDELNNQITPQFGDDLKLDYDKDEIEALAPKRESKWTQVNNANHLTVNEKREALGYGKVEGGDVLLVPASHVPLEQAGQQFINPSDYFSAPEKEASDENNSEGKSTKIPTASDTKDLDEAKARDLENTLEPELKVFNLVNAKEKRSAWRSVNQKRAAFEAKIQNEMAALFKAQAKELKKAVESIDPKLAEFAAITNISRDSEKFKSVLEKNIRAILKDFGSSILNSGKSISPDEQKARSKFDHFVSLFVEQRSASAISNIEGTSIKKARAVIKEVLSEGIEEGEANQAIADRLQEKFDSLSESRARTIARTEVTIASTQGSLEAAKSLEVPGLKKEWVSADDARSRGNEEDFSPEQPNHVVMNGVQVELHEKFSVPPDGSMEGPGDPSAGPDQVIGCRCVLVYTRGN